MARNAPPGNRKLAGRWLEWYVDGTWTLLERRATSSMKRTSRISFVDGGGNEEEGDEDEEECAAAGGVVAPAVVPPAPR